jgi:PPIC-type PPIASE domain
MRRRLAMVVGVTLVLGGCKGLSDMFMARPTAAAEAGGTSLSVARLAQFMTSIKGVPQTQEGARFLVDMWVDYTLFGQALANGRDLADSATAVQVLWPDIAEAVGAQWHDSLTAHRERPAPGAADSLYRLDSVRVLQHILIRVPKTADALTRATARHKIDQALARLKSGAAFSKVAEEYSEDPGSNKTGGYLPAARRGQYTAPFDSAGWALAPGAMTGVVETSFGYHIIRRPPAAEARDRLLAFATGHVGQKLDSMYLDGLGIKKHLTIVSGAPTAMLAALRDIEGSRHSKQAIASYDGGALTVEDFLRWVVALGPGWVADLSSRPDSGLRQFAMVIAQNKLLLNQADSAGVKVSPEVWASMLEQYKVQLDTITATLGISSADLSDPASGPSERNRAVSLKLESYWDQVVAGKVKPRPIPGPLSAILRDAGKPTVSTPGIEWTLGLARDLKAKQDSIDMLPRKPKPPLPGATPVVPPGGK